MNHRWRHVSLATRRVFDNDGMVFVGLLVVSVLVNGILAILFIALMQALGLWAPAASEAASLDEVRLSVQAVMHRSSAPSLDG